MSNKISELGVCFQNGTSSCVTLILRSRSAYHPPRPCSDGYARLVQDSGTVSKNRAFPNSSMSVVMVSSP